MLSERRNRKRMVLDDVTKQEQAKLNSMVEVKGTMDEQVLKKSMEVDKLIVIEMQKQLKREG